jgi:hypothetical protein
LSRLKPARPVRAADNEAAEAQRLPHRVARLRRQVAGSVKVVEAAVAVKVEAPAAAVVEVVGVQRLQRRRRRAGPMERFD